MIPIAEFVQSQRFKFEIFCKVILKFFPQFKDYNDFEAAIESEELFQFLKLAAPKSNTVIQVSVVHISIPRSSCKMRK